MRSIFTVLAGLSAALATPIKESTTVDDSWIVKLHPNASSDDLQQLVASISKRFGKEPDNVYDMGSFKALSINGPQVVATGINNDDSVALVERDQIVTTNKRVTQSNPSYGLARISHRQMGAYPYVYDDSAGAGTYAYVIDTGIYLDHTEFEGRATFGVNKVGDGDDDDLNGHGTHVAGTIGSKTYGVAKKVNLIAIKVLGADGGGTVSGVIAGIDWAVQDAKNNSRIAKSVANLSLASNYSQIFNDAVAAAVEQGLFVAVAAGNSGIDAGTTSPASEPSACTIGAIDDNDVRASFSNFGPLIDVFAPGVNILSTYIGSPDATAFASGTSMASPHVAGLGAYLAGLGAAGGDELCERIKDKATRKAVIDQGEGSNRKIAFNGNGGKRVVQNGVTWG